jgi:hypothetical protein
MKTEINLNEYRTCFDSLFLPPMVVEMMCPVVPVSPSAAFVPHNENKTSNPLLALRKSSRNMNKPSIQAKINYERSISFHSRKRKTETKWNDYVLSSPTSDL